MLAPRRVRRGPERYNPSDAFTEPQAVSSMPQASAEQVTVRATARPKRVAILLDPTTVTPDEIDHLTNRLIEYWGGGLWPLVPTNGAQLSDDWWAVLQVLDPDIVLAICDLRPELEDLLARRVGPAVIVRLGSAEKQRLNGRFHVTLHEVEALGVTPVI